MPASGLSLQRQPRTDTTTTTHCLHRRRSRHNPRSREETGVRTPDTLTQAFDARDIMLRFAITAPDDTAFLSRYVAFVNFLKSGDNGYLTLRLADVGMEFRVYAVGFSDYSQLIPFGNGEIAASFSVKFREPKPTFFGPVQQTGK
mgnify:CR=1 FL=1